ncbi:MAG: BatD family protein [Gammaproteobacteria bacterium]|jgi:hypothetical protein
MQSIRHFACALALWLPATACLATTAYLQPQAIFEGDIVELLIEYDSKIPSLYALDTTPLETEFEILDTRSRVMRIDGKGEDLHRMQWRLQLLPRSSGNLTVPALSFGNQTSPPLRLEVRPVPESVRASQQVIVELDADPPAPYVGQQTRVIHRLLHNTPVRIDGLAEPGISGLTRFSDREERVYFVERDGGEFRVLERRMDIFPQSAGTLRLPPVVFRGELREAAAEQGDLPGRKISRSSEPLDLQVREPPAEYAGRYWLPARSLEISQKLQPHAAELAVGDSIDWTLVLVARGLTAESLPENLLRTESENFTVYADQASRSNRFEGSDLVGRLEQRFAVIVTGDGPIELPDITLDWWDVTADSPRRARLEGGSIGIARAAANGARDAGDRDFADAMFFSSASGGIEWTRLTVVAILLGLGLWSAGPLWRALEHRLEPRLRRRRIRGLLKRACLDNHASRARALIVEWGRARWPGERIYGLFDIGGRLDRRELVDELARLDAALYASRNPGWRGKRLWTLIAAENRRRRGPGKAAESGLPGLYPG